MKLSELKFQATIVQAIDSQAHVKNVFPAQSLIHFASNVTLVFATYCQFLLV
jgi:hypothetical protein